MGKVIGPGGRTGTSKCGTGISKGPQGVAGNNNSTTMTRGYDSSRTTGLRKEYKESGMGKTAKA